MKKPYGKTILITGASSGIGLAAAQCFAKDGYTVWAASRHCERKSAPYGAGVIHTIPMDVCDEHAVKLAVETILIESGEIGIVLHSAGWGIAGAAEDTPLEEVNAQMETNYYGVLRVNRAVLPAMREKKRGFILAISSVAAVLSIPFQSHYCSSKRALEAYIETLRMEARSYGIRAAYIQPGDTKTKFGNARVFAISEDSPYKQQCRRSVAVMERDERGGHTPESVAKVAFRLAGRKNPPVRVTCGLDYKLLRVLSRMLPKRWVEGILRGKYKVK